MNKKWLYIILLFISLFGITYGAYLYNGTGITQIGVGGTNTISVFRFTPNNYDKTSSEYINQNKRQYFTTGEFTSEVYGTFVPDGRIDLIKNTGVNSNCTGESVSYYFQGNFKHLSAGSDAWGKGYRIEVDPINNYYCPDSGKFSVKLVSRETDTFFDTIVISNSVTPTYLTVTVKDSRGNDITLD
ncbi:hypothetical protein HUU51_05035 [Candidatus Gracilibacteria bacterium]|nr:hypothetical protein [Candidatus Gracilibacteria bacterium]